MQKRPVIDIIYENSDIIAVNKPAGLVVIPDRFGFEPYILKEVLEAQTGKPLLLVHRLDKTTSGVMLFAKNTEAQRELSRLWEDNLVHKEYRVLVDGYFSYDTFRADYPLSEGRRGKMQVEESGKPSSTEFTTLERFRDYTLLKAVLKTGRTHQIRIHLSYLGTPVLADHLYGFDRPLLLSSLKGRKYRPSHSKEEKPLIERVALHSFYTSLVWDNVPLEFTAPLPKDFNAVLTQLRKHNKLISLL